MNTQDLAAQLEAVLFVSAEPQSLNRLAKAVAADTPAAKTALAELAARLAGTGLRLSELEDHYSLVTAPETAATVRAFLHESTGAALSPAALETLAVVAYRGPVTRTAIDELRGVASETTVRSLLTRGLIAETAAPSPEPGHPKCYTVSQTFLNHFGLASPRDLPPLPDTEPAPETLAR